MTYPSLFLVQGNKKTDGSFFLLPDPCTTCIARGRSCTTSSVWKTCQRSLLSALLKRLPRGPFRKAGAKVLPLFRTSKYFNDFFSINFSGKTDSADFQCYHFFAFFDEQRKVRPFSANQMPNRIKTVPTSAMGVRGS